MRRLLACAVALWAASARGDELSADDKLRVVYSTQFTWTTDGLPLVPIGVADHIERAVISVDGGALHLLPDGQGGADVTSGQRWTVHVENGAPAELRYHVVVAEVAAQGNSGALDGELARWRGRGWAPKTFDVGTVFGARGQVVDGRRHLVTVAPQATAQAAQQQAAQLAEKFGVTTSVHSEVVRLPRGRVIAVDEHGAQVSNDGILWFAPSGQNLLALDGHHYAGQLYATLDHDGHLLVVNAVPENRLLEGLLPAEIGAGAPTEALKAQAVAARNELLAKIGTRHFGDPFRLCNKTHCQVYAGADGARNPRVIDAVAQTRGELLVRADGTLVDAVYSADCGGATEDNERIWGGNADASLRGRRDDDAGQPLASASATDDQVRALLAADDHSFCAPARLHGRGGTNHRWQRTIDLTAAATRLGVGAIKELVVEERGPSGRIARLTVLGDSGKKVITGELDVRRALGMLPSALFVLDVERQDGHLVRATATGGGHGHGIGLCQQGAVGRALAGQTYKQILMHYYSGATIKKLY